MVRIAGCALVFAVTLVTWVSAQRGATGTKSGGKVTTQLSCAADLGEGVKSRRQFCDVIIATAGADSVSVTIPPHTGPATLMFDLHNRFTVAAGVVDPAQAYVRYAALAAIVRPNGQLIQRAAVVQEYRTVQDLFDRIGGGGRPSGLKAVAPGQPQAVKVSVPAGVAAVGIVGLRLEATTRTGNATHESPGRAIAIVSNLRVEFVPK
jgi:hypothetical protein